MAKGKKRVIREQTKNQRERMKRYFSQSVGLLDDPTSIVTERYGSTGKMFDAEGDKPAFPSKDQYDSIEIDIPEGLNDKIVTAVVMGAIMRPDRLSDRVLSSGSSMGGHDILGFNRTFIMQNLIDGDKRTGEFVDLLPKARQEAKEALIEYSRGNKEPAQKMYNDFMDATIRSSRLFGREIGNNPHSVKNPEYDVILLSAELLDDPRMEKNGLTEIDKLRLKNHLKMQNAYEGYLRSGDKLVNGNHEAGSDERKKLAEEYIFNSLLANLGQQEAQKLTGEIETEIMGGMLKKIGVEPSGPTDTDTEYYRIKNDPGVIPAAEPIVDTYQKYNISDLQAILAQENGKEKLMEIYGDAIRNSDHYKEIVNAKDSDAISDVLEAYSSSNSFAKEFPDIKVPNESAKINRKLKNDYDKEMAGIEKAVISKTIDSGILYNSDRREYGIHSIDNNQMKKNAEIISGMYQELDSADVWYKRSSETFRNLKKELKDLKNYAQKLADAGKEPTDKELGEYERRARKVNALTENYINNKVVDGDYAQNRINTVSNIRRHLGANLKSVLTAYENKMNEHDDRLMDDSNKPLYEQLRPQIYLEHTKNIVNINASDLEEARKKSESMSLTKDEVKKGYRGDNWKNADFNKVKNPNGYSIDRTGAYSIALAAIAAEGKYSLKELMDPTLLQDKKAEKFDEVMKHIQNGTKEDQKWIAENIYKGQKEMLKIVNKEIRNINFRDPDYKKSDKWIELKNLSYAYFDTWQEMKHCEDELMPLVQADQPEIKKYDDYKNTMSLRMAPLTALQSSDDTISDSIVKMSKVQDEISLRGPSLVTNMIKEKALRDIAAQAVDNSAKVPFTDQFLNNETALKIKGIDNIMLVDKVNSLMMDMAISQESDKVLGKFLDGSALKDVKAVFDPSKNGADAITITGLPTVEQVKQDLKYETMDQMNAKEIDRLTSKAVLKLEKQEDKAGPLHREYLGKSENAVTNLAKMIKDKTPLTGNNREIAVNCIKDIFAEKMIGVLEKDGVKLPMNSKKDIEKTIVNLPQFKKATEYIGTGTIGEFAYEDKATELIKSSMKDIRKELDKTDVSKELKLASEKKKNKVIEDKALNIMN